MNRKLAGTNSPWGMRLAGLVALSLIGFSTPSTQAQTIRYVGTGYAYTTIVAAVTAAADGDTIRLMNPVQTESNITFNKSLTLEGLGITNTILQAATARGAAGKSILVFPNSGSAKIMTFRNLTFRYGNSGYSVAGVYYGGPALTTTWVNCYFTMNDGSPTYGGGVLANDFAGSMMVVSNCTFATNTSTAGGSCIYSRKGSLSVYGSTFIGNTNKATGHGGVFFFDSGTGPGTNYAIANCTFIGNQAASQYGGVMYANMGVGGATTFVDNCTMYSNSAAGGGAIWIQSSSVELHSSIIATNLRSNVSYAPEVQVQTGCRLVVSNSLAQGAVLTNGSGYVLMYNSLTNTSPKLLPLANNGGPTLTMALQSDSPCTNRGSNLLNLSYDQRGPGYSRVIGSAADIGAYEYGAGPTSLVYSATVFNENAVNDGTINNNTPLVITLVNDTFNGTNNEDFVASGKLVVASPPLPAGLTAVATRTSGTTLSVTLAGTAPANSVGDSVSNLTFAFQNAAFTGGNTNLVAGATRSDLQVIFIGSALNGVLSYSTNLFSEAMANDGSIDNSSPMVITLANDTFTNAANGTDFVTSNWIAVSNLPSGLTAAITRSDSTHLSATLSGNAASHNAAASIANLAFAFKDAAFTRGNAASVTNYNKGDLQVRFRDPVLTYSTNGFVAAWQNDGSIDNSSPMLITLAGDALTGANGQDFVAGGKLAVANLANGLTVVATRSSASQLSVVLNGAASPHIASITNLTFTFANGAFAGNNAAIVTNASRSDLQIVFPPAASNWYVSASGSDTNPGTAAAPFASVSNAVAHLSPVANDTIVVGVGTFACVDVAITVSATLQGAGKTVTILQADPTPYNRAINHRILSISANAAVRDLTLQNGNVTGTASAVFCDGKNLTLANCRIRQNQTFNSGSGENSGGTVYGGGGSQTPPIGSLTLTGCDVQDNLTWGSLMQTSLPGAGAVLARNTTSVSNCVFTGNSAPSGGGIWTEGYAPVLIVDSTFMSNTTTMTQNDSGRGGGGVHLNYGSMERCTVAYNVASNVGAGVWIGPGSRLVQCTIYSNVAFGTTNGAGAGAGVYDWATPGNTNAIYNCTIAANIALDSGSQGPANAGGGGIYLRYGTLQLIDSIVAGNTSAVGGQDIQVNYLNVLDDHSLVGINNASTGITTGAPNANQSYVGDTNAAVVALLGPLASNGGRTLTCALLPGSLAINHGVNPLGLPTDQRGPGYVRQTGVAVDIGAFEYGSRPPITGSALFFR